MKSKEENFQMIWNGSEKWFRISVIIMLKNILNFKTMNKVVSFGEIMLRLSTEGNLRFGQATAFGATYGGGEFNVAVSLANYGVNAEFVTRLPENEIGQCALREMRKLNVESKNVIYGGERLG